jgi:hypothetical protein
MGRRSRRTTDCCGSGPDERKHHSADSCRWRADGTIPAIEKLPEVIERWFAALGTGRERRAGTGNRVTAEPEGSAELRRKPGLSSDDTLYPLIGR